MKRLDTAIIPANSIRHKFLYNHHCTASGTGSLKQHNIRISIKGITKTLKLTPRKRVYIGRFNLRNEVDIDLDLSNFGGLTYGVSRVHACFEIKRDGKLYITDLQSTNGTLVNGRQLESFIPQAMCDGDRVVLGNLLMIVHFNPEDAN